MRTIGYVIVDDPGLFKQKFVERYGCTVDMVRQAGNSYRVDICDLNYHYESGAIDYIDGWNDCQGRYE